MRAGVDVDMGDGVYNDSLVAVMQAQRMPLRLIDESVRRVLRAKYALGLFTDPYRGVTTEGAARATLTSAQRATRAAARAAIVLLKNDARTLPLARDIHTLAVIGALADDRQSAMGSCGAAGEPAHMVTGRVEQVRAVQVNYADYRSNRFASDSSVYTQFRIASSVDRTRWRVIGDLARERRDRPNASIELPAAVRARYIRYEHRHVGAANLAISDIRVFGKGGGAAPPTPGALSAVRDADARNARIGWSSVPGVVGYNVRWGIAADRLYQSYQRFADVGHTLDLRALTVGRNYYVAIETFDENGVSGLSPVIPIR